MDDRWLDDEPIDVLIARVRTEQGKSQYVLADMLRAACSSPDSGVDRDYVSRWENRKRIPTPFWRGHLSVVLGIPVGVLDRAVAVARARRAAQRQLPASGSDRGVVSGESMASALATAQHEDSSPTLEEILNLWDGLMRRRDLFAWTGATAATSLVPGFAAVAPTSAFDDPVLSRTCAELTATYRRLDNLLGPYAVFTQALDHHQRLSAWSRQARNDAYRKQLGRLVADSGDLIGWLYFDLEQYDQAGAVYRQAAQAVQDFGDDVSRQAYLVGRMSRTLSECGKHDQAMKFASAAAQLAGTSAAPAVRSWLAATRAYVHACLGNERACREDLEAAAALLDRAAGEPREDYITFYGYAHLHKWGGHSLLKLGERKTTAIVEGQNAIDQAFQAWSHAGVRESAEVLTARASARLAQREIPEAARLTGRAYEIAVETRSPRNLRQIRDLRVRLGPYRHTRAVRGLDEQLGL